MQLKPKNIPLENDLLSEAQQYPFANRELIRSSIM